MFPERTYKEKLNGVSTPIASVVTNKAAEAIDMFYSAACIIRTDYITDNSEDKLDLEVPLRRVGTRGEVGYIVLQVSTVETQSMVRVF